MSRINQLEILLKENPRDSFLRHALALEYVKLGDDEQARIVFEALLKDEPDYIGSYYHLGKLFERRDREADAIKTYETGMEVARQTGDTHALGELKAAHELLVF